MTTLIIGLVIVAIFTGLYVALRNAQDFSDANEVVPGVDTGAPKAWAGAHSIEARLHRRLRDAVMSLRDSGALHDPGLADLAEALQREAVAVDERLVAAAALASRFKTPKLAEVANLVDHVETTVADIVSLRGPSVSDIERGIQQVRVRLGHLETARAELQGLGTGSGALEDLQRRLAESGADPDAVVGGAVAGGGTPGETTSNAGSDDTGSQQAQRDDDGTPQ